ncbi:nuclear transport factor 2 family protein [Dyella halodurans]|uniref:Nuclear transport factor 2 family protein n=1 Tax=Dyella halodurans TaxID=1920171 RepID=A0ABV9C2X7_9GAMM|nr:nuclear transport factor 2 family protein [Dyella halodurans]
MSSHDAVLGVMHAYFDSIYTGNADGLRAVFLAEAKVSDNVQGQLRVRSAEEYIEAVASRKSPHALGERQTMSAISINVLDGVASVTARVEMLGQRYFNVLSLLRHNGRWLIVHKLFGHIES